MQSGCDTHPIVHGRNFFGTELSIYDALNSILEDLAAEANVPFKSALTKDIHVLPDFNGNRCA